MELFKEINRILKVLENPKSGEVISPDNCDNSTLTDEAIRILLSENLVEKSKSILVIKPKGREVQKSGGYENYFRQKEIEAKREKKQERKKTRNRKIADWIVIILSTLSILWDILKYSL